MESDVATVLVSMALVVVLSIAAVVAEVVRIRRERRRGMWQTVALMVRAIQRQEDDR